MAERRLLVCDRCGSDRQVAVTQSVRGGKRAKADLCDKCHGEMSRMYHMESVKGTWSKTPITNFEDIPRHKP